MKPIFAIDVTTDKKNDKINGEEFVTRSISAEVQENFEEKTKNFEESIQKSELPAWLSIIKFLCGLFAVIVIAAIIRSLPDTSLAQMFKNASWLIISGAVCGIAWVVLQIISKKKEKTVLAEENIEGREVECAVLGNEKPIASVIGEILPANEFYDYEAKYIAAASKLCIPAELTEEKSEEIRARYREIVTQCENCPKVIVKDSIKLKYFDAFRNNVVIPYLEGLKRVNMPLSPEDKQEILDQTIELAMQAVDIADAAEWTINNRSEQKLNLDIVSKSKTRDDAYEEAIIITDNPAATPKWIRALSSSIIDVVSDSCKIIFSGYRR